jgi:hydrogenase-4 component E
MIEGNLIITLMIAHLIASILAVEIRNLKSATIALCFQALFLSSIFAAFAQIYHNPSLYWWSLTALITKVIIIPWLLFIYIRKLPKAEVTPFMGLTFSISIVSIILVIFYRFVHTYIEFVAPTPEAMVEPARSNLALSFMIIALGLYVLVARKDAIKVVIGLCLLENGVHLSLITLAPGLPETTLIGIATNVVIAAWLLLYLTGRIFEIIGSSDTSILSELRR